jgi:type IV secretion system protein VirB9
MMTQLVVALLAASALATPAFAEAVPAPGQADPRMRTVVYDPANVTVIIAAPGRSTSIELAEDEKIHAHSLGDDKAWVFVATGNHAFVTPVPAVLRASNVQIIAVRPDGSIRLYQLDLVVGSAPVTSMAGVRFTYPSDIAAKRAASAAKERDQAAADTARERLATDFFMGVRNWKFVARGSEWAEPTEVSDNGRQTAFRFPGNRQTPAIYTGQCGRQEAIAPVIARDDLVLVETTAAYFCMRLGAEVTEIRNVGYDPTGFNPGTGTSSPEVVRTISRPYR